MNIREKCKLFLDFVYESKIIPEEILKIIEEHTNKGESYKWDFRKIVTILAYNSRYTENSRSVNNEDNRDKRIANLSQCFNNLDVKRLNWFNLQKGLLLATKDICNNFFHNVCDNGYVDTFNTNLVSLISASNFLEEERKNYYLAQMQENFLLNQKTSILSKESFAENTKQVEAMAPGESFEKIFSATNTNSREFKSAISEICKKQGVKLSSVMNISKLHSGNYYWINPSKSNLHQDWSIILHDKDNKVLYMFYIPAHAIPDNLLEDNFRLHREDTQKDIKIRQALGKFVDEYTGYSFKQWYCGSINYKGM